jgi:hypothetical protein
MNIFDNTKAYEVGDTVFYNDKVYEAIATIPDGSENPVVSYDWTETYVNVSEAVVKPYVERVEGAYVKTNTTKQIKIIGNNFDDNIEISSPDFPQENIKIISITPTEIIVEITGGSDEYDTSLNIYKSGVKNFGITPNLVVTSKLIGEGPSGIFLTTFSNDAGDSLWGDKWDLEVFGTIASTRSYFVSSSRGTPSGGTGPNNSINGSYYSFCETSNPNNGVGNYGQATTSYFKNLVKMEFDYFMYGATIGDFGVWGYDGVSWVEVWKLSGQQQTTQDDDWIHEVVNVSAGFQKLRLVFNGPVNNAGTYTADICINNIKITSID